MSKKDEALLPKGVIQYMLPGMERMTEKEKTTYRKTEYYRRRMKPETLELEDIRRIPTQKIWVLTRVSLSTIKRWKDGSHEMPFATQQLLKFYVDGIIPVGFGSWTGGRFAGDMIYPAGSATGYTSGEVIGFYLVKGRAGQVPGLELKVKKLEKELLFHKQQTVENSRLGFMHGMIEVMAE